MSVKVLAPRPGIVVRGTLVPIIACLVTVHVAALERLADVQITEAIARGRDCGNVPLVKVGAVQGDFDVFIEGPFAPIALHAAAARQMHQPFDPSKVKGDVAAPDYRVWTQYIRGRRPTVSVNHVVIRQAGKGGTSAVIQPVRDRPFQLTVGHIPAHGIIDEVRFRRWEWVFDHLPVGEFQVMLDTSAGLQKYAVTDRDRARLMRVCT